MRRPRFHQFNKLTNGELKWRLGLWVFVFILIVNLIVFFNTNDKKDIEDEFGQKSVEDLIREKGKNL